MAYSRLTPDSNTYVYCEARGLKCCYCSLNKGHEFVCNSATDMMLHLEQHEVAGDKVLHETYMAIVGDIVAMGDDATQWEF